MFDEVAQGGMATVHLGRLLGSAGFARTVVIKRMKAELAENNEFVEMFVDEARLASRVQHPNVVSTLDVVRDGKELFIVMEYVHGRSLDELIATSQLRGEKIPPRIVSALGVQALLGLHAAHEATSDGGDPLSLVHRDFSPHNVLVDVDGAARVVDFGVAKAAQKLHKTRDGQVKGKWAYMSPEQVEGIDLDRRSDIFAAGIVLWEALTCRRLFHHENPARIATDIVYKDAPPPSKHAGACPPELDAVVLKALQKEPEARYATAKDMAKALREAQAPTDVLDVASWLEEIAGPDLEARAEQVAAIEKASASMVVMPESAAISLIDSGVRSEAAQEVEKLVEERRRSHPSLPDASVPDGAKRTLIGGTNAPAVMGPARASHPSTPDSTAVNEARKMRLEERPDELAAVIRAAAEHIVAPSTPKVTPAKEADPALDDTHFQDEDEAEAESAPESGPAAAGELAEEAAERDRGAAVPEDDVSADGAVTASSSARDHERHRRRFWVGLILVVLALAAVLVLALGRTEDAPAPAPERAGSVPSPALFPSLGAPGPSGTGPSGAGAAIPTAASEPSTPPSTAAPSQSPSQSSSQPSPPRPRISTPPAPRAPAPQPKRNCDPPYTLRNGVKEFKPECF